MNSLLKIVKEFGINLSGSIIGMGLNYVLLIVITRFLAPKEYGIFVLAESIVNFSLIFVLLGMHKALDRFIPFFNASGEFGKSKTLISTIFKITLFLSLIIGVIFFFSSGIIANYFFKEPKLSLVLKIVVLSIPLLTFLQIISFTFIGYKELRYQVYIQQIARNILKVFLGIIIFFMGYRLIGWSWMYVMSLLGASLLAYYFFKNRISISLTKVEKIPISFKEIISYSWPLSINSIILLFLGQIGVLLLGFFRSPAEVGVFRIYIYMISILALILHSFAMIYKPVTCGSIAKNDLKEVKVTYRRVSKWIFLINGLGLLILFLFGRDIIRILFTKDYLLAPTALIILAAGRFLNSSFGPEGMTLEAFGNTKLSMLNSIIMLGTNLGLAYLLIPRYGIVGAAVATATSITVGGLAGLIEIFFLYRLQPFSIHHIKYICVGLISGGILFFIKTKFTLNVFVLIGLVSLLTGIYIAGLYYSKSIDDLDYEIFHKVKAKFMNLKSLK